MQKLGMRIREELANDLGITEEEIETFKVTDVGAFIYVKDNIEIMIDEFYEVTIKVPEGCEDEWYDKVDNIKNSLEEKDYKILFVE